VRAGKFGVLTNLAKLLGDAGDKPYNQEAPQDQPTTETNKAPQKQSNNRLSNHDWISQSALRVTGSSRLLLTTHTSEQLTGKTDSSLQPDHT
jgi:hypothetical protein